MHRHASRLLLLLAAFSSSLSAAAADDDVFTNTTCSAARSYNDSSPYGKDVAELQKALATPGDHWWFRGRTVGQVSGLAMCYADADAERCLNLLNSVVNHYRLCDHSRSFGYLSSVGLAYGYTPSNDSSGDPGARLILSLHTAFGAGATAMREARVALLSRLAERAGNDALRFAAGTQGYNDTTDGTPAWMPGGIPQVMYGMAQCALDLPPAECSSCLVDLLANTYSVMFVNNSTSARLMELRCYLRYQINQPITFIPGMVAEPPLPPPAATSGSAAPPTPLVMALLAATLFISAVYY
ncbi:unnamed protein product [Urochloa humidicola]